MPDGPSRARVGLALACVYVVWSSTYFALRIVAAHLPPLLAAGSRYFVAGLALMAIRLARGDRLPPLRAWGAAAVSGLLLFCCGNGFIAIAEQTIASGVAAVVCGTMPLWAALLGRVFFGLQTRPREWVGMAVGVAGVGFLGAGADLGGRPLHAVLLLLAPVAWASGSLLARRPSSTSPMLSAAMQMITGGASMMAIASVLGDRPTLHAPAQAWIALAYLTVVGSLITFAAYVYLLRHARPAVATSYAYVNPALAVVLGAVAGAEPVRATTIAATALVIASVGLTLRR